MSSLILYISQLEQQGSGAQWDNVFVSPVVTAEMFNIGLTSLFILFDSVLYGIIGMTVIMIKDLKTKEKESLSNIFSKIANCWLISVDIGTEDVASTSSENSLDIDHGKGETVNHENDMKKSVGVHLENLTKAYTISRNEERVAVSNLSLSFNVGEVTVLSITFLCRYISYI